MVEGSRAVGWAPEWPEQEIVAGRAVMAQHGKIIRLAFEEDCTNTTALNTRLSLSIIIISTSIMQSRHNMEHVLSCQTPLLHMSVPS